MSISTFRITLCIIAFAAITVLPAVASALTSYKNDTQRQVLADTCADCASGQNPDGSTVTTPPVNNGGAIPPVNNGGAVPPVNNGGAIPPVNNGGAIPPVNNGGAIPPVTNGGAIPGVINNPLGNINNLCDLINVVLNIIAELGAIVAVLFIIWSGFLFIKAQGNASQIKAAKDTFYTTIIGTAILVGASVITKIIVNTVGSVATSVSGSHGGNICS